jgi:large subunit ribosomal protein L5
MKKNGNTTSTAPRARLHELYVTSIRPKLKDSLQLKNVMQVPGLKKIAINVGVKEAVSDTRALQLAEQVIAGITGQLPVRTYARKSIAGFKIREGMPLGVMVTLRGRAMYEFLDRLINLSLPKVRDFQGVSPRLDGRGSYNLGIREWNIFPEAEAIAGHDKQHGLNITIETSAQSDAHGYELLKEFGMPFRKK